MQSIFVLRALVLSKLAFVLLNLPENPIAYKNVCYSGLQNGFVGQWYKNPFVFYKLNKERVLNGGLHALLPYMLLKVVSHNKY